MHIAVSGADGTGGNARSRVNAAKTDMRQAAAPHEKARPCTFQHIVTINKVKGKFISWHPLYTPFLCLCECWTFDRQDIMFHRGSHKEFIMIITGWVHLFCSANEDCRVSPSLFVAQCSKWVDFSCINNAHHYEITVACGNLSTMVKVSLTPPNQVSERQPDLPKAWS